MRALLFALLLLLAGCASITSASELLNNGQPIVIVEPVPTATRVPDPTPVPTATPHAHDGITLADLKEFCHPTILHGTGGCFLVFED